MNFMSFFVASIMGLGVLFKFQGRSNRKPVPGIGIGQIGKSGNGLGGIRVIASQQHAANHLDGGANQGR